MKNAQVPGVLRAQRLENWIRDYSTPLLRMCFVYLSDRAEAQDALQDAFLKAWRSMDKYEKLEVQNDKAWLMRICINVCRDYHRSSWRKHVDRSAALDELPPQLISVQPEDRTLLMDVCRLPEKYKQVLLLYYYQEMTLQETADTLSIPRSTAYKRLQKAQELLKGRLTGRDMDA